MTLGFLTERPRDTEKVTQKGQGTCVLQDSSAQMICRIIFAGFRGLRCQKIYSLLYIHSN